MCLRMKLRYYTGFTPSRYHWEEKILPGAWMPEARRALKDERYRFPNSPTGERAFRRYAVEYFKARMPGPEEKKKIPQSTQEVLTMTLRHGDMVVMMGPEMQKYYEVSLIYTMIL